MRVNGADHLVDVAPEDLIERKRSRIVDYDRDARVVTTGSGRHYLLLDAPAFTPEKRCTFALWCAWHGLGATGALDVSHRYCLDREAAQQKLWCEEARWVAEQIARGKLSGEVSFPYAWSNRRASADVVMLNALLRPDITDLVRLSLRHGMPELQRGLEILKAEGSLTDRRLALTQRILDSIELGIAQPIPPALLKRARDLCAGMSVDLDKPLDKHDD